MQKPSAISKSSPEFDRQYARLNPGQRAAVDAIDGPIMVIAGPGTGKTTILTLRIANILRLTDTPANGILAITYTDAGVKAMRQKLTAIIGDRAHDVRIHTFHGFASSIIAEYPDHFLHIADMKQMTDIEQESLVRSIISDPESAGKFSQLRPAGKPDVYISGILRSIDDAKREALTPDMVKQYAKDEIKRIQHDESSISTKGATKGKLKADAREAIEKCERTQLFADVYELYEKRKHEADQMDFNDLINELRLALRKDELLLQLLQERYLYIHVDEHQDTNGVQNEIITIIAEFFDVPNIFIVGDEKQAIYRFQGASVENFQLLMKKWPTMRRILLDTNYRSHQSILDASFSMIEKNYEEGEYEDLRIRLKSGRGVVDLKNDKSNSQAVTIVEGENTSSIEKYLVNELKMLVKNEPQATVAVIVRRNRDLERVIRLLESHSIPVSSQRSVDIFSHPVGRLFFDLIEYLADPSRTDALAKTIVARMWGLSFEKSAELIKNVRSGQGLGELETQLNGLASIHKMILDDGAVGFVIHAAEESGFIRLISQHPSYIHVWRGIVSLAESLAREGDIHDPAKLMKNLLTYRLSAESRPVKITVGAPDLPIQAMTAHGSKGLEFDYVFITYATEESWVGRPKGASFVLPKKRTDDSDIRDVRRLFYVALTRARKSVTVLSALEESDGKRLIPLRFIDELDEKYVSHVNLPRIGSDEIYNAEVQSHVTSPIDQKIIDITKHVLTQSGLSVTALNHFLKCPNEFIYQSILKLPQAPSVVAEKGTAMHEALSKVWRAGSEGAESRGHVDIEKILTQTINEYFDKSFLPTFEKESAKKELLDDVAAVSKALEKHFEVSESTTIFTESWVRTEFAGQYDGQKVAIPLHGKLDALVDTGSGQIMVYDYKTRQSMSVAAIKGETKSSDGGYFRQLVFYRMLVGDDSRWRGRAISPALVFVSPDDAGRCPTITLPIDHGDIEAVKSDIQSLIDAVWSGKIAHMKCDDIKCEWCGMREIN